MISAHNDNIANHHQVYGKNKGILSHTYMAIILV